MHRFALAILLILLVSTTARSQDGLPQDAQKSDPPIQQSDSLYSGAPESIPQVNQKAQDQAETGAEDKTSMFSTHLIANRYWVSGQANFIFQAHGSFNSPYQGTNSFVGYGEHALSRVLTLYTGVKLARFTEILFDLEETGGGGLSQALGIAGFTNLDVVR